MIDPEIQKLLAAPFPPDHIGWKPQAVKGNRALAIAYIDARNVMDRLDETVGVDGWQDSYELLPDSSVVCVLRVRFGERWVRKSDVGGPSEQPDGGDRLKAAFSDALKRAAVKFGIGRYLYSLPHQWCDYDPQKRQFTGTPRLPDWAIPGKPQPRPRKDDEPDRQNGKPGPTVLQSHAEAIEAAETFAELSEIWKVVSRDHKGNRITDNDYGRLNALKETCKRKLAGTAPGETGDPDADPFAAGPSERQRLEATK